MRWTRGKISRNIEDRRHQSGERMRRPGGAKIGLGGIVVLLLLSFFLKRDLLSPFLGAGGGSMMEAPASSAPTSQEEQELVQFVSFVLDDNQETWTRLFPRLGSNYREARLVLFRDAVDSACGFAQSATGPFYCPGDQQVYIDLGFYEDLKRRFGAPGDFAQAYVLAHEIGHHVQQQLGIEREVRTAQQRNPGAANQLSVKMELQADCLAGVWASSTERRGLLESGDVEEALNAAASIGDDRIQRMSGGRVSPESFTHGSSAQRVEWFRRGLASGDPDSCNTFAR